MNSDSHVTRIRSLLRFVCTSALVLATVFAHGAGNGTDATSAASSAGSLPLQTPDIPKLAQTIEQLSPKKREELMQAIRQLPTVTIKGDNPNCFLEKAAWSSCFNDLPAEPKWSKKAASDLYSPRFWQLRSLWTKTPIEHIE